MDNARLRQLLCECLLYLDELKERESREERKDFFQKLIGLTSEELEEFGIEV